MPIRRASSLSIFSGFKKQETPASIVWLSLAKHIPSMARRVMIAVDGSVNSEYAVLCEYVYQIYVDIVYIYVDILVTL